MSNREPNHYAALGLDRHCTDTQIRSAYRLLAKQLHPDLNPGSTEALARTRGINEAYAVLGDPSRRQAYDAQPVAERKAVPHAVQPKRNITQDVHLRIDDFLRGTMLDVRVNDPANTDGPEIYSLTVPAGTAPGTRFRLDRSASPDGGFVVVRARARPDFRFKTRGSDLRCDLRIDHRRAAAGGSETVVGPAGTRLRVTIPPRMASGEIIRLAGEGLPKTRGGRGDLLVRIVYRPEIRITRSRRQ